MLTRAQSGGIPDIFGNLLSGYQEGQKAKYLKPSLEEALKKAQIANKHAELANTHAKMANDYYKPLNDSLLELRQAQTGEAQAKAQKAKLIQAMQAQLLGGGNPEAMQGGEQGNGQMQPNLSPYIANAAANGNGAPSEQGQYALNDEQMARLYKAMPPPQNSQRQNPQGMQSSDYAKNAMISHLLGLGQPQVVQDASGKYIATSPLGNADTGVSGLSEKDKAREKESAKINAQKDLADFKTSSQAQQDLPVLQNALKSAYRMRDIIKNRPGFWGHYIAPELFAKRADDPLVGEFQGRLVPQIAEIEKQLSVKGNQLALKTANQKVPLFSDSQTTALGKADAMIESLIDRIKETENLSGGVIRRGNKRFKRVNGEWHELEKDER
jgi:hypothetical protein